MCSSKPKPTVLTLRQKLRMALDIARGKILDLDECLKLSSCRLVCLYAVIGPHNLIFCMSWQNRSHSLAGHLILASCHICSVCPLKPWVPLCRNALFALSQAASHSQGLEEYESSCWQWSYNQGDKPASPYQWPYEHFCFRPSLHRLARQAYHSAIEQWVVVWNVSLLPGHGKVS